MKIMNKIFLIMLTLLAFFPCESKAEKTQMSVARAYYELARQNNTQKIESLLYKGYPLNSVDSRGYNAVCISIVNQDKNAYKTLISYGASKNPPCIQRIPDNVYHRFFGVYPDKSVVIPYTPDEPYLISTAVLGVGAITGAALLISGSGGGGGSSGGDDENNNGGNDDKKDDEDENENDTPDCPVNSSYNQKTKKCECNAGYGNYGDSSNCYASIPYCVDQVKDVCKSCDPSYIQKDNKCYAPIPNCQIQDGGICNTCYSGFGVHGGDGTTCYKNIENCDIQNKDKCESCISGYGVHGGDGSICYKNIENCDVQIQTKCKQCRSGYNTYGDPAANVCYKENPCSEYANTVPKNYGQECVCNENKGYSGTPGNCIQTEDGDYQEGDGSKEEWNDLNAQYCNSHGKYSEESKTCECYTGYANAEGSSGIGCQVCDSNNGYIEISGLCFFNLNCESRGEGFIQSGNLCVCDEGYYALNNENGQQCIKNLECELHHEQYWDGTKGEMVCQCKAGFDENCDQCLEGYTYDEVSDVCVRTSYECDNENGEKWTGENCDICPSQYKVTEDEQGVHCGLQCADNRAAISNNPKCETCNEEDGYGYSEIYGNCIKDGCTSKEEGYTIIDGICLCDETNGYFIGISGKCQKKEADLVGISSTNINNSKIDIKNDGVFRDVYGMKPVIVNEESNEEIYFDNVYNGYATNNEVQTGEINITNNASGNNVIYGIYSQSNIYNVSTLNNGTATEAKAFGFINITDTESLSDIYGIKNIGEDATYNSFVYASGENSKDEASNNYAEGGIYINKPLVKDGITSTGNITGIEGGGNIFNAYADSNGVGVNVNSVGTINIKHEGGQGTVIGIKSNNQKAKINNAYAFLNSAVSDVNATGVIEVSGNKDVYGIYGKSTVTNAESQFDKSFSVIGEFKAEGTIDVSTKSSVNSAYGIYIEAGSSDKTEVYNAMGYNTKGTITASNAGGGNVYGIYSNAQTYIGSDEGDGKNEKSYYNNVYNAFRSSARYGGDNVSTEGKIELEISGNSATNSNVVGIYSAGNAFNSFANSGSDIKLETVGNINIVDTTQNSNVGLKGIEANGNLIANAYSKGANEGMLNTDTVVTGDINIKINNDKNGTSGYAAGIYTSGGQVQEANIYNAALINSKNSVTGKINITSEGIALNKIYGIYAKGSDDSDQPKMVYNAYYENDERTSEGSVKGEINVTNKYGNLTYGEYYGIYVAGNAGQYSAYNTYSSNKDANVEGVINVDVKGGLSDSSVAAIAVGMYGENATLNNSGNSTINVKTSYNNSPAYGMKGTNATIYNDAVINVEVKNSSAYGLYANKGTVTNDINGIINVKGEQNNYGIYALSSESEAVKVINLGTINLTGAGNNTGIYASGEKATVENRGNITINGSTVNNISDNTPCSGEDCPKNIAIKLENGATLNNNGQVQSTDNINFNEIGGNIVLDKNGQFISQKEISGDLQLSENIVIGNFDKEATVTNALVSESIDNLNITSNSYMYASQIKENNENNYDVVLKMKDFSDVLEANKAQYYTLNYNQENNIELFNAIKSASNHAEVKQIDANISGTDVLPNITQENLKVMRSLDTKMMSDLFKDNKQDVRKIVGADAMFIGRDDHGTLTGYDIDSQSMYALYDTKLNNNYRLGLGLSFTHSNTDYNDDSSRKNFMVQGYVPLTYSNTGGLTAVSMARLGYSDGEYTRYGYNESFDADTSEITYGLLNELRYSVNVGGITFTPFVGLNAVGWYQKSIDEGDNNLALKIDSANVFSLESALGIYVDKNIKFDDNSKLSVMLGAGYYHEFADPYKGLDAQINNTIGNYKLRDIENINSRDRGILSAKVNYDYKDFSIYGELMQYLEKEYPVKVDVGLKYKF